MESKRQGLKKARQKRIVRHEQNFKDEVDQASQRMMKSVAFEGSLNYRSMMNAVV